MINPNMMNQNMMYYQMMMCQMYNMMQVQQNQQNDINKNLTLTFEFEKEDKIKKIKIFCQSKDKIEKAIDNFLNKSEIKKEENYEYFINKKIKINSTFEENVIEDYDIISVKKKRLIYNNDLNNQNNFINNNFNNSNHNNFINNNFNNNNNFNPNNFINDIININNFKENNFINNNFNDNENKINVIFMGTKGWKIILCVPITKTIRDVIQMFYIRVEVPSNNNKIFFLYNAEKLNTKDNSTIGQLGGYNNSISITVIDNENLIGA